MIHKTDDGAFVISSHGCWLPGVYADEKAARWAFSFDNETLLALQGRICNVHRENRPITTDDLRAARRVWGR